MSLKLHSIRFFEFICVRVISKLFSLPFSHALTCHPTGWFWVRARARWQRLISSLCTSRVRNLNLDSVPTNIMWDNGRNGFLYYDLRDENSQDVQDLRMSNTDWVLSHYLNEYFIDSKPQLSLSYQLQALKEGFRVEASNDREHWIYWISKKLLPDTYKIEFDYIPRTVFNEQLQIVFAAKSLADRHRFILEFNSQVYYQIIRNGFFLPRLSFVPYQAPLHQTLHVRFEKVKNVFSLFFNDKLIMCKKDTTYNALTDRSMLLFWNGKGGNGLFQKIDFEINNFNLFFETQNL